MKYIIPSKDAEFDAFQAFIVAQVIANQAGWGISNDEVTALGTVQLPWTQAWAVAKNKDSRTSGDVQAKNDARTTYEAYFRPFLQRAIVRNPRVTDGQRQSMGIKPRETHHSPIPVPDSVPVIQYDTLMGNKVKIYYRQQVTATGSGGRGRPHGVASCDFIYKVGGAPPVGPQECNILTTFTRSPFTFVFTPEQAGQKVYAYARWKNAKGQPGGWTQVIEFIVPK